MENWCFVCEVFGSTVRPVAPVLSSMISARRFEERDRGEYSDSEISDGESYTTSDVESSDAGDFDSPL